MNAIPPTTISSFLIETMMVSQGVNLVLSVNMIQNYVFHPITFSRIHRIISQRLARRGWRWRWWAGMTRSLFTWVTSDKEQGSDPPSMTSIELRVPNMVVLLSRRSAILADSLWAWGATRLDSVSWPQVLTWSQQSFGYPAGTRYDILLAGLYLCLYK